MKFTVEINDRLVRRLIKKFPAMLDAGISRCAHELKREIKEVAPQESGALRASVNVFKDGYWDGRYRVGTYARSDDGHTYATYVDQGTGERHETFEGRPSPRGRIYPKYAKAFTWITPEGAEWYAKSIAGIHAQHFFKEAYENTRPRFRQIFLTAFQQRI